MNTLTPEEIEIQKKAIYDSMSPRRQKHIMKKGWERWNPFQEPKDPIDIRKDQTQRTTQQLIREFIQTKTPVEYSNAYGRGVLEICLGIVNGEDRFQGMYDFSVWYHGLLKKEGYNR